MSETAQEKLDRWHDEQHRDVDRRLRMLEDGQIKLMFVAEEGQKRADALLEHITHAIELLSRSDDRVSQSLQPPATVATPTPPPQSVSEAIIGSITPSVLITFLAVLGVAMASPHAPKVIEAMRGMFK